jgi:hypothetical protein
MASFASPCNRNSQKHPCIPFSFNLNSRDYSDSGDPEPKAGVSEMSTLRVPTGHRRPIRPWQRLGCHATAVRWPVEASPSLRRSPPIKRIATVDPLPGADAAFDAALLDPESPVAMLGEPTGVFDDLWVRQHAAFSFRAQGAITALSVEVWTPPEADPFVLAVRLENEPEMSLSAPGGHIAILQYPLYAAPFSEFTIELIAGVERQLDAPDQRRAAYNYAVSVSSEHAVPSAAARNSFRRRDAGFS